MSAPTAVVTGAGSGIGHAFVTRLADDGYDVFAFARRTDHLDVLDRVDRVTAVRVDIRDAVDVDAAARLVGDHTDRVDVLVNSAGILAAGTASTSPVELWRDAFDTNVIGTLRVTQALLPRLRHDRARIIVISSVAAAATVSPQAPYAASKAALERTFEALAQELHMSQARVMIVQPGIVPTPIHGRLPAGLDTLAVDERRFAARLGSFVRAQLPTATTPAGLVDDVLAVAATADPPLILPIGDDGVALTARRRSVDDTDWVRWWGQLDDGAWAAGFEAMTGVPAPTAPATG